MSFCVVSCERRRETSLVRERLVGEECDAKLEVGALEVCGQRGELSLACDAAPTGTVDGHVLAGAVKVHGGDASVGKDREADESLALLVERWARFLGDQGVPVALDVLKDSADVGAEVDGLRVGEDLDSGAHALLTSAGTARGVFAASVAIVGCLLGCLTDDVTGAL